MFYLKAALLTALTLAAWLALAGYAILAGWWHSALAPRGDHDAFANAAAEILAASKSGNSAFALLQNGALHTTQFTGMSQRIDADTIFPTASTSKWLTAMAILRLVEDDRIDLDAPVANYLTRWQLPPSEFDHNQVTVRRLLSHTSGLTDGLGFGDYAPAEAVPPLEDSLQRPRASSGRDVQIAIGLTPGTEFSYSGGGYLILQLVVEEVSGQTFADYASTALFAPLGMRRSTFDYIGPFENRSNSYDAQGNEAPLYRYAAAGATAFASSVGDLVKLVQALQAGGAPLRPETVRQMRQSHARLFGADIWGLGAILYAPTDSGDYVFGHDGQNEPAINTTVRMNPDNGDAIIVLVSGHPSLATRLGFEWVFWQTGVPDTLGLGFVMERGLQVMTVGGAVVLIIAGLLTWRVRRRRA